MFRAIFSIIFCILAGLFLYLIEVISFYSAPEALYLKITAMAILCGPMIILLFAAHAFLRFLSWKRHTGLVLISATLFACFIGVTLLCMSRSEAFVDTFGHTPLPAFTDYKLGVPFTASVLVLGVILYYMDRERVDPDEPEEEPE